MNCGQPLLTIWLDENKKFLTGIDRVVGKHKSSVAAGGWIKMRSVREVKKTVIGRTLNFQMLKKPGLLEPHMWPHGLARKKVTR
jgi:hypothetical protein